MKTIEYDEFLKNKYTNKRKTTEEKATDMETENYNVGEVEHSSETGNYGVVSASVVIAQETVEIDNRHVVIDPNAVEKDKKACKNIYNVIHENYFKEIKVFTDESLYIYFRTTQINHKPLKNI